MKSAWVFRLASVFDAAFSIWESSSSLIFITEAPKDSLICEACLLNFSSIFRIWSSRAFPTLTAWASSCSLDCSPSSSLFLSMSFASAAASSLSSLARSFAISLRITSLSWLNSEKWDWSSVEKWLHASLSCFCVSSSADTVFSEATSACFKASIAPLRLESCSSISSSCWNNLSLI